MQISEIEKKLLLDIKNQKEKFISDLENFCKINSGSWNYDGIEKCKLFIKENFHDLRGEFSLIDADEVSYINENGEEVTYKPPKLLRITHNIQAKNKILLTGHLDTVFPKETNFPIKYLSEEVINAPGAADMKGGILILLYALRMFEKYSDGKNLGYEIIFNNDEEIGSPASREVFSEYAKWADLGFIYEPTMSDGYFAGARKGSANFDIVIKGISAHAGREHEKGKNAVIKASQIAVALAKITDYENEITLNVAKIDGGDQKNIVPDKAIIRFNLRAKKKANMDASIALIKEIISNYSEDGFEINLFGGITRPAKEMSEKLLLLFKKISQVNELISDKILYRETGGVCDGNNISQFIPVIDTMGMLGGKIHTKEEYAHLDKVTEKISLSALIFTKINNNEISL